MRLSQKYTVKRATLHAIIRLVFYRKKAFPTKRESLKRVLRDAVVSAGIFGATIAVTELLSRVHDDNNPFAAPLFILAVALIARLTTGYFFGILATVCGVLCVNCLFTYPFGEFDMTLRGYPLTFTVMLLVSVIVSTLTTQIKRQERLRYEVETEKMRANLLRSVSHDLRTPLASISGASSTLLENELSTEEQRDLLREINKDARWLIRVTENILSLTKFSGSDVLLRTQSEVLEEIVGSAIVKFRRNYPNIRVSVSRPEQILLAPMDAVLIEQVLLNLFENVALHAQTADHIQVRIFRQGQRAVVEVEDNGEGFPPDQLEHVFEGRMAPDTASSNERRSMGIGLSVCRSILRAHHGEIEAYNVKDGGGVRFWLPCEEDEEDAQ